MREEPRPSFLLSSSFHLKVTQAQSYSSATTTNNTCNKGNGFSALVVFFYLGRVWGSRWKKSNTTKEKTKATNVLSDITIFFSFPLSFLLPSSLFSRRVALAPRENRESSRKRALSLTMARDEDYSSGSDEEEILQQRAEAGEQGGDVAVESSSPPASLSSSSLPSSSSLKKKKKAASPAPPASSTLRRKPSSSRVAAADESSLPVVRF